LKADADRIGQLLLGQAEQAATPPQALSQVKVDIGRHAYPRSIHIRRSFSRRLAGYAARLVPPEKTSLV
jgi:hypothetical protein